MERKLNLPLDIVRYINKYVKYEKLANENINKVARMWITDKLLCQWNYGHISYWDVSQVTNMKRLFLVHQILMKI